MWYIKQKINLWKGFSFSELTNYWYQVQCVSLTETDIDTWLTKASTAINRLSVIWKSDLTDKMKCSFFQAAIMSILLYGCTTWTLTKRLEKKLGRLLQGAFNRLLDFFVQAFKIVVESWKLSMLLLYILWDDWPISMISGSNEQLQQQLEYTLLKPDCHSWWFSKMQSGREDTLEEWYAIKLCFKLGKNATETYGMLQTAFQPSCMNRASVFEWHKRFKEGRDDEWCGRSKEVNRPELIGQRVWVRVTMLRF